MTQWEYARLTQEGAYGKLNLTFSHRQHISLPKGSTFDSILRNLGDDGWEIISMHIIPKDEGGGSMTWFKQPVAE